MATQTIHLILQWIAFWGAVDIVADQMRLTAAVRMLQLSCLAASIVLVRPEVSRSILACPAELAAPLPPLLCTTVSIPAKPL